MTVRLAVVSSHPIQHFCPQYSSWSRLSGVDLHVFFAARIGLEQYFDPDFGANIAWHGLSLDFPHSFLPGAESQTSSQGIDCPDVAKALSEFDPDVVLVYGYAQPLQRRAATWAKANKRAVLMISDAEMRTPRSLPKRAAKRMLVPRWLRPVDVVMTVGDTNEAFYRHYGLSDTHMVRASFPIDISKFDPALARKDVHRAAIRTRHHLPEDAKIVFNVGKLIERKRPVDLIDLANRSEGRYTVLLAGSGPQMDELRARTRTEGPGGVIFLGFTQPDDLIPYYCGCDLYLHPSQQDPHPLSVSEAIYCGVPAIVSDRTGSYGPNDDVQPGVTGFTHRCGDVDALKRIVDEVLFDTELLGMLGAAARDVAVRHQRRAHGDALMAALRILGQDAPLRARLVKKAQADNA